MPENETVRQHYVPRTYLKHFSIKKNEEYFIKALPTADCKEENIFEPNIANICLEKDLYTLPGKTAKQRMFIENFYSDNYENHYDHIYSILTDPERQNLSIQERQLVISTVVTMLYRTKKWVTQHNTLVNNILECMFSQCQQNNKDYFFLEKEKVFIKGKTIEQIKKEFKTESRPAQALTQLDVAIRLLEIRSIRDAILVLRLEDDNDEFITSDNPVIYANINGGHAAPFDPSNILKLPLDNKHILSLMPYSDESTKHLLLRKNLTGAMCFAKKIASNYEQFCNSERFILGTNSALKEYLQNKEATELPLI